METRHQQATTTTTPTRNRRRPLREILSDRREGKKRNDLDRDRCEWTMFESGAYCSKDALSKDWREEVDGFRCCCFKMYKHSCCPLLKQNSYTVTGHFIRYTRAAVSTVQAAERCIVSEALIISNGLLEHDNKFIVLSRPSQSTHLIHISPSIVFESMPRRIKASRHEWGVPDKVAGEIKSVTSAGRAGLLEKKKKHDRDRN